MKKNSLNRRLRRKMKRFINRERFVKFQKFSMICMIGNPAISINQEEGLGELLMTMMETTCTLFVTLRKFGFKFLKMNAASFQKLLKENPYVSIFVVFACCTLALVNRRANQLGNRLLWYDYLIRIIGVLVVTLLLSTAIKFEAFKTILKWLKAMIIRMILALRNFNNCLRESTQDIKPKPSKPSKPDDFGTFVLFSTLTFLTAKCLLYWFKRKIVGDVPFADQIIRFIEMDAEDYIPKLQNS